MAVLLHLFPLLCVPGIQVELMGGLGNWLCSFEGRYQQSDSTAGEAVERGKEVKSNTGTRKEANTCK